MSDTDLLHQPDTLQPPPSFKPLKLPAIIAVVLFITLVAGTGGYWLGKRTTQSVSQSTKRISFQPSQPPLPLPINQASVAPIVPPEEPYPSEIFPTWLFLLNAPKR